MASVSRGTEQKGHNQPKPYKHSNVPGAYTVSRQKDWILLCWCVFIVALPILGAISLKQKTQAVVPVTVLQSREPGELVERQSNSSEVHPTYQGLVHFHNTFDGQLAATEYPKVTVRAQSSYGVF